MGAGGRSSTSTTAASPRPFFWGPLLWPPLQGRWRLPGLAMAAGRPRRMDRPLTVTVLQVDPVGGTPRWPRRSLAGPDQAPGARVCLAGRHSMMRRAGRWVAAARAGPEERSLVIRRTGRRRTGEPQDAELDRGERPMGRVRSWRARRPTRRCRRAGWRGCPAAARCEGRAGHKRWADLGTAGANVPAGGRALVAGFVDGAGCPAYSRWRGSAGTGRSTGMGLTRPDGPGGLRRAGGCWPPMGPCRQPPGLTWRSRVSSERLAPLSADRRAGAGRSHPSTGAARGRYGCSDAGRSSRQSLCGGPISTGGAGGA